MDIPSQLSLTGAPPRRFKELSAWLAWQETLHVKEIELGLERCRTVAGRMGLQQPLYTVVTVGGTNGKGSSVAMLDSILRAAGYRVAMYTSPHLARYNERLRINGMPVSDEPLCEAFQHVDDARGETSLTYFEFGTLAALDILKRAEIDLAILEVGLGGRLDAVNIIDPDVALLTAIGIDHVEWLGHDRAAIAREKAGILRAGRPAVCSDPNPPWTVTEQAERIGSALYLLGRDYAFEVSGERWSWHCGSTSFTQLPRPGLRGDHQFQNAAGVLMVLSLLAARFPVPEGAIRQGLAEVKLEGRFQVFPGPVEYILDVAHNPQAAGVLGQALRQRQVSGRTHILIGMLKDKDARGIFQELGGLADHWHIVGLQSSRGASSERLANELGSAGMAAPVMTYHDVAEALTAIRSQARAGDRVVITGSFLTIAQAMRRLEISRP